ncbi:DeoR family transcriptional regulator [Streptomyces pathocidini]|uniref:DeoR family transcriptional regulator n=1 Tax=Streptomyces pathocidini TaxID=1650571 RepID=UPI0033EDE072
MESRHERILRIVRERETLRITKLAAELDISRKRHITVLAQAGRVRRLHGSVSWPTNPLSPRDMA